MGKQYTAEEINTLVAEYKATKKEKDIKELMDAFEGFIIKYLNFLKHGLYQSKDKDLLDLCYMLTPKGTHSDVAVSMVNDIMTPHCKDDVLSELQLIFLKCVHRYQPQPNPGFPGFIYNYYKYMVKDWIKYLSKDVMNSVTQVTFQENFIAEPEPTYEYPFVFDDICFSDNRSLNSLEKYVLYLSYSRGLLDKEIAKIIGIHRAYITIIRNNSIKKFQDIDLLISMN